MDLPRSMVRVEPGPGIVLRMGPAVVLLAATSDVTHFEAELRVALSPWSVDPAAAPGTAVRAIAKLLITHRTTAPALGAAVQVGAGFELLLHGAVRALISSPDGDRELSGLRAATWVDHLVTDSANRIWITLGDRGAARIDLSTGLPDDTTELVSNRVRGGGMIVIARHADPPGPVLTARQPSQARSPASVDDIAPPAVRPRQRAAETKVVVNPVAALVADDGTRTLLDRNYVFGRDPHRAAGVASGEASPVTVADPDNLISRVQAYVSVAAGDVLIMDNESTNGTFIAEPGAQEWQRLGPAPTVLPPGWSLRMGRRVFTHIEAGF